MLKTPTAVHVHDAATLRLTIHVEGNEYALRNSNGELEHVATSVAILEAILASARKVYRLSKVK